MTVTQTDPDCHRYNKTYTSGFDATPGYDLASGLGTPDGVKLVAELAGFRHGFCRPLTVVD